MFSFLSASVSGFRFEVYGATQQGDVLLGTLPKVGANIKVQPSVKEKREVVGRGNSNNQQRKYKIGGKEFSQEQVQKAASKYKMTVEQYLQSVGGQ